MLHTAPVEIRLAPDVYTEADLARMSSQELEHIKNLLHIKLGTVEHNRKDSTERYGANASSTRKTAHVERMTRASISVVNSFIKKHKEEKHFVFADLFINAASDILDLDTFGIISAEAKRRLEEHQ